MNIVLGGDMGQRLIVLKGVSIYWYLTHLRSPVTSGPLISVHARSAKPWQGRQIPRLCCPTPTLAVIVSVMFEHGF